MSLPHHNLVVWQRADDLFIEIHKLTHNKFPREEKIRMIAAPLKGLMAKYRRGETLAPATGAKRPSPRRP